MSDIQKTIQILEGIPEDISNKLSIKAISETFSIIFSEHEEEDFEPTIEDFIEALYIRMNILKGIEDAKNGRVYTTEELKKELGLC